MYTIATLQRFIYVAFLAVIAMLPAQSSTAQEPQPAQPQATPAAQATPATQEPSPAPSPQPAASPRSAPTGPPTVKEELVAEISPGSEYSTAYVLGNHLIWAEKSGDRFTVRLDGKQLGATYQEAHVYVRGKADDPHVLMVAKRQGKWVALYDGQERTPEYESMTSADTGPEGHPLIVGGCRAKKKCYLILDGKEAGPEFEEIAAPDVNFKSGRYVYFGQRGKKWVAMLDGKETGPEMDDFSRFSWGPEGKYLAVAARLDKKFTWIVDGKPGPLFDVIGEIVFSRDGQHYAYGGARVKSGFGSQEVRGSIVVDGQDSAESWKGEGLTGGWTAMFGSYRYVLKGVKGLSADFHGVSDPEFTAEGNVMFAQRQGDGHVVVHFGGRAGPAFDDVVSSILTSDDGKHVAYIARQGDQFVEVRDQMAGAGFPGKRELSFVGWIAMNKDGTRLAYEIVRGGNEFKQGRTRRALRRVVIDGKSGPEYDSHNLVPSRFSDEGNHYLYTVHGAKGDRDLMVFDGVEGPLYDDIFSPSARFVDGQTIEFIARQGRRFLRVTMKLGN